MNVRTASNLLTRGAELSTHVTAPKLVARLAPSMMGADGPGFGIVRFDNGKPTADTVGPNTDKGCTPIDLDESMSAQLSEMNIDGVIAVDVFTLMNSILGAFGPATMPGSGRRAAVSRCRAYAAIAPPSPDVVRVGGHTAIKGGS